MGKYTIAEWTDEDCLSTEEILNIIQYKYVGNILANLSLVGEMGFGELKRSMTPISGKVLTERLKYLLEKGLIKNRKIKQGNVQRSYYSISHKPKELQLLLKAFKEYSL